MIALYVFRFFNNGGWIDLNMSRSFCTCSGVR